MPRCAGARGALARARGALERDVLVTMPAARAMAVDGRAARANGGGRGVAARAAARATDEVEVRDDARARANDVDVERR